MYGASQCLNESSIRWYYINKETNQGSLASAKACQSCNEEVGAIIRHCVKTQCAHKPSCARTRDGPTSSSKRGARRERTRAISQHHETSHCKRRARGARTRVRTTSSSKRGARCARTRAISRHRETSHCMHRPGGART